MLFLGDSFFLFLRFYLFIFREKGRKGEREGEKYWCERDTLISCLLHTWLGTWLAHQACVLTGNWTSDLWGHRLALNPLSHTNQVRFYIKINKLMFPLIRSCYYFSGIGVIWLKYLGRSRQGEANLLVPFQDLLPYKRCFLFCFPLRAAGKVYHCQENCPDYLEKSV